MKALSIKQPWASLIAHGIKNIENRTWKTHFRGRIYIHASGIKVKSEDFGVMISTEMYLDYFKKLRKKGITERSADFLYSQPTSAIIGEVDIIDCVVNHESIWAEYTSGFEENGKFIPNQKPIYNWVLANAVLYDKPILNVKGKLSFWDPDIDIVECIGCVQKFNHEEMKQDDSEENFCSQCWDEMSPSMIQETKECNDRELLEQFGKVVTICQSVYSYEFLITDGFSTESNNTFACIEACCKIANDYPFVKKCVTDDNKFHLILTKEKK